ncbi:MAG: hypothetical protein DYG98_09840 [Haliscomenobacteraceae bacterium CHB4]|nr:hypothetical protein [Saprospiraceae bacterium]MCE7923349.1 hypothetical protein [Haliscomenobacteraceae bacterium CHB4]
MKSRSAKITFLFALYAAFHFAEACNKNDESDCDCAEVSPFFDYKKLKVGANTPVASLGLSLKIDADSLTYLANAPAPTDFGVISSAWACSCLWNGHEGPKYGIQSLNIYADRDFNDTLPVGTSLNSLFYQLNGDALYLMQPDYQPNDFLHFESGIRSIEMTTYEKPTELAAPFVFRVEIVKSTGDTLTGETEKVFFL